jgi:hypothetical protein
MKATIMQITHTFILPNPPKAIIAAHANHQIKV